MLEEKRNGTVLKQFKLIGMTKNRSNPLGAKNNDSRPCMGASAILKSVDFIAFAVNVKTIAPTGELYQSGHAIWCKKSADQRMVSLLSDRLNRIE